ncbi:galectin-3-binding protein-like [Amphiura filiformis]|uniref:galectin-3-binding protein-like n=1 Tax=Amphiura filiformis TaxID=82378 RepID=UPI003B224482
MNFNNSDLSDIIIQVGGNRFHVQKMVLCVWSDIFHTMCDPKWANNGGAKFEEGKIVKKLEESEDCIPVFGTMLQFMYTGNIQLPNDNIYPILKLADKYNVVELKGFCAEYLLQFVSPHSVKKALDTLCYAESFDVPSVVERCLGILATYFQQMTGKYLSRLNLKELTELVSRDDIVVNDEFMLYKKVEHWYTSAIDDKKDEGVFSDGALVGLLSEIRFEHMSPSQLREVRLMKLGAYVQQHHPEILNKAFRKRIMLTEGTWDDSLDDPRHPRLYLYFHRSPIIQTPGITQKFLDAVGIRKLPVDTISSASRVNIFDFTDSKSTTLGAKIPLEPDSPRRFPVATCKNHGVYIYNANIHEQCYCNVRIGCYYPTEGVDPKAREHHISVVIMPDETNRGRLYRLVVSLHPVRKDKGRAVILTRSGMVPDKKGEDPLIRLTTRVRLGIDKIPEHLSVSVVMFVRHENTFQ